jgi:CoA:oxalate CoA-transferase
MCDFFGGVHLYGAIMTALYEREKTGVGRLVEVSMQEAVYASLSSNLGLHYSMGNSVPPRTGNRHGGLAEAPYNVYPTSDGHIAIICVSEAHWKALLKAMQREELLGDARFADLKQRVDHMDEVDALVAEFTARHTKKALFDLLMAPPCALCAGARSGRGGQRRTHACPPRARMGRAPDVRPRLPAQFADAL